MLENLSGPKTEPWCAPLKRRAVVANLTRNVQGETLQNSSTTCTKHPAGYRGGFFFFCLITVLFCSFFFWSIKLFSALGWVEPFLLVNWRNCITKFFLFFYGNSKQWNHSVLISLFIIQKVRCFYFLNSWKYGCLQTVAFVCF